MGKIEKFCLLAFIFCLLTLLHFMSTGYPYTTIPAIATFLSAWGFIVFNKDDNHD